MKRRDFLIATAGLAGGVVPVISRAQTKPCPPSALSISGAATVQTVCAGSGAAPTWFVKQAERTWAAVADSPGQQLIDAYHGVPLGFGATFRTMTQAWTGGCVDQARGELIFAANGGHADYAGNEVYACSIRSEVPRWYRLTDPSPAEMIVPIMAAGEKSTSNAPAGQGFIPSGFAAMYLDGRMRAVHGYQSCLFANGSVWYPYQSAAAGIGHSTPHAWMFDRNAAGIPTEPEGSPLPWRNDPGPWKWLGSTHPENVAYGTAPPAALDPVTGKIWSAHAKQATRAWSSLDTSTGIIRGSAVNIYASNTGQDARWAAIVVDPSGQDRWRMFVAPAPDMNGLIVLDLKAPNPFEVSAWSVRPATNVESLTTLGLGAVYHKPSKAIILGDPRALGGKLLKIRVPTRQDGSYDPSAAWVVSIIDEATGSANPASTISPANQGARSKFNIIEDMGNGQSALVVCMEVNAPTYVYKLPMEGI